ncbi:MAG: AAA family ATPase [Bacteroidota bacterium]
MRIHYVKIQKYKNLKVFSIDLNEKQMYAILLGQNASGKSNFIEALVAIFRNLQLEENPEFSYEIKYECRGYNVKVVADAELAENKTYYQYWINENRISGADFKKEKLKYLPRYVIAYYSGSNLRLEGQFFKPMSQAYKNLLDDEREHFRTFFYSFPIYKELLLLSFFCFPEEGNEVKDFLEEYFDIESIDSLLFELKRPYWAKNKSDRKYINHNEISFWQTRPSVFDFLKQLHEISLAPIQNEIKIPVNFHSEDTQEVVYLYIPSIEQFQKIAQQFHGEINFFQALDSLYLSDLIQSVRIKLNKATGNDSIFFSELSEGEQQLIAVLGLIRFTKSKESLILLDEPDTHLNPIWKWRYTKLLKKYAVRDEKDDTTQIIMTTHDPLVIGGLTKEEIRIFKQEKVGKKRGEKIVTFEPEIDPRGLGVEGILTSEFFGLETSVDEITFDKLKRRNELLYKMDEEGLSLAEKAELKHLFEHLNRLGFAKIDIDPYYREFLKSKGEESLQSK